MIVIVASLVVAALGLVTTYVGARSVAARNSSRDPHTYWALGIAALAPAWLVVFVALLGPSPRPRPELVTELAWIASTTVTLLMAITTEALLRRAAEVAHAVPPLRSWRLGVLTFVPGWAIVVLGYAVKALGG